MGPQVRPGFANRIRRRLPRAGDKWHLDEVVIKIAGRSTGSGVPSTRTARSRRPGPEPARQAGRQAPVSQAAEAAMPGAARLITDKLASYGAAKREIMPGVEHRQHKGLNNRAENSHQPTRRRERQ